MRLYAAGDRNRGMKNLIISDTHIDRRSITMMKASTEAITAYLERRLNSDIDMIYLAGDIHELWHGRRLHDKQAVFEAIVHEHPAWYEWLVRRMEQGRVVYVTGNHDYAIERDDLMHPTAREVNYIDSGRHVHIEHGHQADWFNSKGRVVGRTLTWMFGHVTRALGMDREALWSLFSERFRPGRDQSVRRFRAHWMNEARVHGWDVIVTGHSHAEEISVAGDGKVFANSGTWINRFMLPMVSIEDGRPELEYVEMEAIKNDAD